MIVQLALEKIVTGRPGQGNSFGCGRGHGRKTSTRDCFGKTRLFFTCYDKHTEENLLLLAIKIGENEEFAKKAGMF
ncbi:MAG: hypothetical protein PSY14_09530 [bacterium]|nr:hypothetical protein [bacterium]